MDDKLIHKFINNVKNKFIKAKTTYPNNSEYAFSTEEIENINKQNKQKIQELKKDIFTKKKDNYNKQNNEEILSKIETNIETEREVTKTTIETNNNSEQQKEEIPIESTIKQDILDSNSDKIEKPHQKNSFINLNPEHQKLVMDKWQEIKLNKIDKDIIDGKDLLNHNYTITYADEAAKFIHYIRKEYEVVICYLIGFNNEKQGIFDKTIFSDKIDNEWKYLNSYIKILEKIRKNR